MMKARVLPVGVFVFAFLVSACSNDAPALDSQDIVERLRAGEVAFLSTLDIESTDPAVGFSLGRALEARGMRESARLAYQRVIDERGVSDELKALSAGRLATIAARGDSWTAARVQSAIGLEYGPALGDLWYQYGRALYEAEEYEDLREWLAQVPAGDDLAWEQWDAGAFDAEVYLWRAVAAMELNDRGTEEVLRLFTALPAGEVHRRVYLYLYYGNYLDRFTRNDALLIEGVYRVSVGEHGEALRLFSLIETATVAPMLLQPESEASGFHRSVERAIAGAGTDPWAWLDRLGASIDTMETASADDDVLRRARGRLAVLRTAAGGRDEIETLLEASARLGDGDPDLAAVLAARRRRLEMTLELPVEMMIEHARDLEEPPESFDTIVDSMVPALVRGREWERLAKLRDAIPPEADTARAHLAMLLAAADQWSRLVGGDIAEALAPLVELPPTDYFGLVARRLLGRSVGSLDEVGRSHRSATAASSLQGVLVRALFDAGRIDESYDLAMRHARTSEYAEEALDMARLYREYGYVPQALGLARRAIVRGELPVGTEEIDILYPRPFSGEFAVLAERFDIDDALFYGLVREESHFNPTAVSPVGAEGLAQLMPATAEDMQRRMRVDAFEVYDPSDNLTVGAYYLAYLAGEISSPVLRVAAYNAGLGRGRSWEASFGDLPPLLQIEAVPFFETRWYLRKIAVSAAWYARLLDGTDPVRGLNVLLTGGR